MDFAAMMRDERLRQKQKIAQRSSPPAVGRKKPLNLEDYKVGSLDNIYYVPDWITEAEERLLVAAIHSQKEKWVQLTKRRLQNWIISGLRDSRIISSSSSSPSSPASSGPTPNHCLLNEYADGQGIDKHNDGELYLPFVVILSLQSPALMEFEASLDIAGRAEQAVDTASRSKAAATVIVSSTKVIVAHAVVVAVAAAAAATEAATGVAQLQQPSTVVSRSVSAMPPPAPLAPSITAAPLAPAPSPAASPERMVKEAVLLQPRSVLIFTGSAYEACTHVIHSVSAAASGPPAARPGFDMIDGRCVNRVAAGVALGDRVRRGARRLSLTLRRVAKVVRSADADGGDEYTVSGGEEKARKERWFLGSISERSALTSAAINGT